jgi:hypothetical protein
MGLRIHPAPLAIEDPWGHLKAFLTLDGSRKYDTYIASGKFPQNRITDDDATAINTSMSARSRHEDWRRLIERATDIPELAGVDPA